MKKERSTGLRTEIQGVTLQAIDMASVVKKIDMFGSDSTDEFKVKRENGLSQGIFKTWAVPVIPFLENDTLHSLSLHLKETHFFGDSLNIESLKTLATWNEQMSNNPIKLLERLERWRLFSEMNDRRLQKIFLERPIPEDKEAAAAELFLRLTTAFGFAAPFYHVEAMAGDTGNTPFNPIIRSAKEVDGTGGGLDLVALALPSALKNKVITERLNWNGLSWSKISELARFNADDPESMVAFRISKFLGVEMEDVIFAANVLEWIPVSVGGKKEDLKPETARELVFSSLKPIKIRNTEIVGRNINALIRFLNWFPLVKDNQNFNGSSWRYAAVCDTSDALLGLVNSGGILRPNFEITFRENLAPQIKSLDATSAKGRFMLQLLREGKIKPQIEAKITESASTFFSDISEKFLKIQKQEQVVRLHEAKPRSLVGGKAAGIREAGIIFGQENVLPGVVFTTEAVENWIKETPGLWKLITELDKETNSNHRITIAQKITARIVNSPLNTDVLQNNLLTRGRLAIRSSSFDEDTDFNGTSAGIYESMIGVEPSRLPEAIKTVVASFFSEKAVSYRQMQRLSDLPMFAIVIAPFIEGRGGAAFSRGNGNDWEIVVAESPSEVVSGAKEKFDSFKKTGVNISENAGNDFISRTKVLKIGQMIIKAEKAIGQPVDFEFVVDSKGKVWILQLRSLKNFEESTSSGHLEPLRPLRISQLEELDHLKIIGSDKISLKLGNEINIDQFQGNLFRWLTANREKIKEIVLTNRIPRTSHFANICINLGIKLTFDQHGH